MPSPKRLRTQAAARQQRRTAMSEDLLDAVLVKLTEKINSEQCRSQDLKTAIDFFTRNNFQVSPSKEGKENALDQIIRERKERERRERNMARAKAQNEKRAEEFYRRQENPNEPTPRLSQSDGKPASSEPK